MRPVVAEAWGDIGVVLPVQFAALIGPGTRLIVAGQVLVVRQGVDKKWPHLIEFWSIGEPIPCGMVYILRWRPKPHVRRDVGILQTSGPIQILESVRRSVEYVRSIKRK